MIYLGDCIEIMRTLKNSSINSIITDPPYGIDYQSSRRIDKSKWKPKIANDKAPFIWWINEAYRVLTDKSPMLCFCRWDVQDIFKLAIETAGFTVKSQVIWDKEQHGMGNLTSSFAPQHEVILFAVKGKYKFPNKRPKSVIRMKRVHAESLVHPNEKPVALMRHLVNAVTPPNSVVLDPFLGSGSTGVAAIEEGFQFIGIEQEKEYYDIASARIADALNSKESPHGRENNGCNRRSLT